MVEEHEATDFDSSHFLVIFLRSHVSKMTRAKKVDEMIFFFFLNFVHALALFT